MPPEPDSTGLTSDLEQNRIAAVVTSWSLLLPTGVSGTVGLISGFYPAHRAASIDPIDALRYE